MLALQYFKWQMPFEVSFLEQKFLVDDQVKWLKIEKT